MSDIFNHEADAWDSLINGEDTPCYTYPKLITCKRCGTRGLTWKQTKEGWRTHFYDSSTASLKQHACKL